MLLLKAFRSITVEHSFTHRHFTCTIEPYIFRRGQTHLLTLHYILLQAVHPFIWYNKHIQQIIQHIYFSEYQLIPSRYKKSLMIMNGYTFSMMHSKRHWYCSKRRNGCRAKVIIDNAGKIIHSIREHDHPPPLHHITSTGKYVFF